MVVPKTRRAQLRINDTAQKVARGSGVERYYLRVKSVVFFCLFFLVLVFDIWLWFFVGFFSYRCEKKERKPCEKKEKRKVAPSAPLAEKEEKKTNLPAAGSRCAGRAVHQPHGPPFESKAKLSTKDYQCHVSRIPMKRDVRDRDRQTDRSIGRQMD